MSILSDFPALLFDVDLTLTNSRREVSSPLIECLKQLAAEKKQLGVCTGRAYVALKETILPLFPPESLHITAGGSQIVTGRGEVIWEQLLETETCQELHQLGQKYNQMYYIPTLEFGYGSQSFVDKYQGVHSLIPPLRPVSELTEWKPPFMVFVNVSPEFQQLLEQRTDITVKTSVSTSNFVSVDVTANGVNKAVGIGEWCKAVGLTTDQIIGIGDSDNDVEFLQSVGFAVGMGNSTSQIKAIVDRVIGETDEDGLAVYLDTLLKGSQL